MMPVQKFAEPHNFDTLVRQKGLAFLAISPQPTTEEYNKHAYWRVILPEFRVLYKNICNFCSTWIPHSTGQDSVDHFEDKSGNPQKAYEWDNFRYVSARFNSRKSRRTIIDPFVLPKDTFILNFTNFFVEVNPSITDNGLKALALDTIKFLGFNEDDILVEERSTYFFEYSKGAITLEYLKKCAPFVAYEIERQGL